MVAEAAADAVPLTKFSGIWHYGGYCSPFDLSAACLVLGCFLISSIWSENYGSATRQDAGCSAIDAPLQQMRNDTSILLLGAVKSPSPLRLAAIWIAHGLYCLSIRSPA